MLVVIETVSSSASFFLMVHREQDSTVYVAVLSRVPSSYTLFYYGDRVTSLVGYHCGRMLPWLVPTVTVENKIHVKFGATRVVFCAGSEGEPSSR